MTTTVVNVSDLAKVVGADGELSGTDRKLLAFAKKNYTPEEMAEELGFGFTPARCLSRVREILRSHDYLDQVERRGLILLDMIDLKEILMDHVRNEGGDVTNERTGETYYSFGDPRWAATLVKLLAEMNKLISADKSQLDVARAKLRRKHAALMMQAIDLTFRLFTRKLVAAGATLDEGVMLEILEEVLPAAIALVEQQVEDDE